MKVIRKLSLGVISLLKVFKEEYLNLDVDVARTRLDFGMCVPR